MIFVVKQLTSTIHYKNYYVLQVFLIAIVHFKIFSKMAVLRYYYIVLVILLCYVLDILLYVRI